MYKFIHSKVIKILLFTIKSLYSTYLGKGKKIARVISDSAHYASTWTCFALNEKNPNFHWPEETSFANPLFPSSSPYSGEKRLFISGRQRNYPLQTKERSVMYGARTSETTPVYSHALFFLLLSQRHDWMAKDTLE